MLTSCKKSAVPDSAQMLPFCTLTSKEWRTEGPAVPSIVVSVVPDDLRDLGRPEQPVSDMF